MISEGVEAPCFELPAVVDGAVTTVDLGEFIGDEIVVLAFYPADFSPACTESASDLREFELFTMQKDVEAFAISGDSVYSHRGFADHYDLTMALLADPNLDVADAYDLHFEDEYGQRLLRRAVAVIDHNGVIQYTWAADDMTTTPDIDAVRSAIGDIASDPTALARYRVGHAHYVEGRRAFTSAMHQYEEGEWTLAQGDFEQSFDEFDEGASQLDSTVRFADDADLREVGELSKEKANALKRAADWLGKSANAYANGQGELAQDYQADAENPLSTAREISEPPEPAAITIDESGDAHVHETMERTERSEETHPWSDDGTPDVEQSEVDAIEQAVAAAEEEIEATADEADDEADADGEAVVDDGPASDEPADETAVGESDAAAERHDDTPDEAGETGGEDEPIPEEIDLADPNVDAEESDADGIGGVVQPTDSIDVKREQSGTNAADGKLAPSGAGANSLDADDSLAPDDEAPDRDEGDGAEEARTGDEDEDDEDEDEDDEDDPIELDLTDPNES